MNGFMSSFRVASVSFFNARPLVWGLENDGGVRLMMDVPSKLLERLEKADCDVALLPTIDYQRLAGLRIVPAGGIGCDGPTYTVRIFARQPVHEIRTLACDPDSHSSVALARIILAERYGLHPELISLDQATGRKDEARLLIGDKVVCQEPVGYDHQYDLGVEWKQMTGLPFVFAVWTTADGKDLGDLPRRLYQAKKQGLRHADELVERYAVPAGWPAKLALEYLNSYLRYDIGPRQIQAIKLFHELAARHGIIDLRYPLRVYEPVSKPAGRSLRGL